MPDSVTSTDQLERRSLPNVKPSTSAEPETQKMYSPSLSNLKKHADFSSHHFKPAPFFARWIHGYNHRAGVINLNDNGSTIAFFAASNFGILYNWTTHRMKILQGHRHVIQTIAADNNGDWIVTGCCGSDNIIIIWDYKDVLPARTIFSPHRNVKLAKLTLSGDAKYLLTLGYGKQAAQLFLWIWSFGKEVPHAKLEIEEIEKESILCMEFNPINSEQYALITKKQFWIGVAKQNAYLNDRGQWILTGTYDLKIRNVENKSFVDTGKNTCFCFVKNTQVLVATDRGVVTVYAYSMHYRTEAEPGDYETLKYIKALKVQKSKINAIKYVDNLVVTGNGKGEIHFYDDQMKLLYWVHGFTVTSVKSLSFNLRPRSYRILDPKCKKKCPCWESVVVEKDPETGIQRNKLIKKEIPTDVTKAELPFLIRDFIVCCYKQGLGFVDFVPERITIFLPYLASPALALTAHPEKNLICIGYLDGRIELHDFVHHKTKAQVNLRQYYKMTIPLDESANEPESTIIIPKLSVTCLKYSPSGLYLACGLNTGKLLFLDPTTIEIKTKDFEDTKHAIKEIAYSPDSLTLAFSDVGKTVCVYKFDCNTSEWNFIGKHRAHYKEITSVMFLPAKNPNGDYKLISLGADRVMAEYDVGASSDEYLELLSIDRMEQSAIPLWGIPWPVDKELDPEECLTHMPNILVANDEYKYKIVNYETTMTLATYLGPRFTQPVRKIMLVTKPEDNGDLTSYLLFATKFVIGLQKLPLDGNPWKHVGMLGHPNQITMMCFRNDCGVLFTIGAKDSCVTQWKANFRSVEKTTVWGGGDLDPYYCLIEDGRPGWLFQEIRDLFYYIQILCQGTFSPAMRRVKDYIPIESLPDLMRALGYFATEYEVENLIVEAKYQVYNKKPRTEIDFEEFVKLYLNHRPALLDTNKKIGAAFATFAEDSKKHGAFIRREEFVDMLCDNGEHFSRELAWYLLSILSGQSFEDRAASSVDNMSFIPPKISLENLLTNILGIPQHDQSDQQSCAGVSMASLGANDDNSSTDTDKDSFLEKMYK